MKVSVSLPEEDVQFLDAYGEEQGLPSRSAVVQKAVRLLRASDLGPAYEEAWEAWTDDGEAALWEVAAGDGVR